MHMLSLTNSPPQERAITAPASSAITSPAANTAPTADGAGLGVSELPLLFASPSGCIPLWAIARLVPKGDERLEVVLYNGDKLDLMGEVAHLLVTKLTPLNGPVTVSGTPSFSAIDPAAAVNDPSVAIALAVVEAPNNETDAAADPLNV